MSLAERWSVTYTKQINKKRAVYEDGFLELQSSRQKVLLYDEYDKLLDSRFTKKEDIIRSGETLKFDSHLVDVGEKCGGHEPGPASNCQKKDKKVAGKLGTWRNQESKNNPTSVAFKKRELNKYGSSPESLDVNNSSTTNFKISEMKNNDSSPSCLDITKSSTIEWQVMYTTQITQKAKKFHDGVLQLVVRGVSQRGQITLLAEDGTVLSHRHLKLSEDVKTGSTLVLANYMVEVGECRDGASSLKDSKVKTSSIDDVSLSRRVRKTMPFFNGKTKTKTSPRKIINLDGSSCQNNDNKSRCTTPATEPKRSAHDILSILRKPIVQGDVKPMAKEPFQLHVSDIHSDTKNHTHAKDCHRSDVDEFKESTSDHDYSMKTIKSEAVEILDAALNHEGQAPFASTLPSISHIKVKIEDTSEVKSGPEITSEAAATVTIDLTASDSRQLCKDNKGISTRCRKVAASNAGVASSDWTSHDISGVEGNTLKQSFNSMETNELPSFDLGF